MPVSLRSPDFWRLISTHLGVAQHDAAMGLHYVVLDHLSTMRVVRRTAEELFSTTASRAASGLRVVVNGNYYDVSTAGLMDAVIGSDPVAASHTTALGRLVDGGAVVGGTSAPRMFHFAQLRVPSTDRYHATFAAGFGDPPAGGGVVAAIGGLGPLIVDGLRYGNGNRYGPGAPAGAPASGPPGPAARAHLAQRNNATFVSAEARPTPTGKTILASHSGRHKLLVAAQPHGAAPGSTYSAIRDALARLGFDNAVFLDGSDSTMLLVNGRWVVRAGPDKDETNTVGVGFT